MSRTYARRDQAAEIALAEARRRGAVTASVLVKSGLSSSCAVARRALRRLEQRGLLSCLAHRIMVDCQTHRQRKMTLVFTPTSIDAPACEASEFEAALIGLLRDHQLLTTKQLAEMSGIVDWRVVRVMKRLIAGGVIGTCKGAQDGPGGPERRYWLTTEANHA